MSYRLFNCDVLAGLKSLPAESVDAVVTDPPYGLKFMGKKWDYSVPSVSVWAEVYRVLKPGGHVLSFGGTRTYHRMACAIEDAGFEIRDQIAWVYGEGMPKSLDVSKALDKQAGAKRTVTGTQNVKDIRRSVTNDRALGHVTGQPKYGPGTPAGRIDHPITVATTDAAKQWDGWGTALKPAIEPICLARKPLSETTVAANVLKHGTGAINVDGCRVSTTEVIQPFGTPKKSVGGLLNTAGPRDKAYSQDSSGRWPANLILDEEAGALLDQQSGHLVSGNNPARRSADKHQNVYAGWKGEQCLVRRGTDSGGASRFFYCAKASKAERGEGNTHPTVKPLKLMRYLIRLITPPGGTVLDPFLGSGTTGIAAKREGHSFIGIELNPEYCTLAHARIKGAKPLAAAA